MMAGAVTDRVIAALAEGTYDFILVNYANPDMVAHTGNYEATLKAISIVDQGIKKIMEGVLDQDGVLIVTSDHGNAEVLIDLKTGEAETKHNPNPVPFYLVGDSFKRSSPHRSARAVAGAWDALRRRSDDFGAHENSPADRNDRPEPAPAIIELNFCAVIIHFARTFFEHQTD